MEAVTTHGPVNPLRKKNLESLFGGVASWNRVCFLFPEPTSTPLSPSGYCLGDRSLAGERPDSYDSFQWLTIYGALRKLGI